jgi:MFS family permease
MTASSVQAPQAQRRSRSLGSYAVDRRPLAIPAFRRLWLASVISAVGGSFSLIAVPAQLFALTGSSATVAVCAAVSFAALAPASLVAGALADVTDRRRLLLVAHLGLGVGGLLTVVTVVALLLAVPHLRQYQSATAGDIR